MVLLIACESKSTINLVSEIVSLNENNAIKEELTAKNDSISMNVMLKYDLMSENRNRLNINLFNAYVAENSTTHAFLLKEHSRILPLLEREIQNFSSLTEINYRLIQKGKNRDSLMVSLKKK